MDHFIRIMFMFVFHQSTFSFRGAEVFVSVSEGQDCELTCSGREGVTVLVLQWIELERSRDLLVFRAGKVLNGYEHPDFTNRVQLLDPHLQRGDLSVVLKDVTLKDSGTYECQALYEDKLKTSQFIRLTITEPETTTPTTGTDRTRVIVLVIVLVIMLCILVVLTLYRKQSQLLRYLSHESCLRKSHTASSGSNTSSSTTSSNLSNGSCKKRHSNYDSPPPYCETCPSSLTPPSESCHLTVVEGFACSNPVTQTVFWSQDLSLTKSSSHICPVGHCAGSDSQAFTDSTYSRLQSKSQKCAYT